MPLSLEIGQKFNRLTIVSFVSKKGYYCLCDCGNFTYASAYALKNNKHKSCGCIKRPKSINATIHKIYDSYKRGAKRKDREFSFSKEEFTNFIFQDCFYCGTKPLTFFRNLYYNGIDRQDNSLGYIEGNCVTCCKICNHSKATLTQEEWFIWLKRICTFQKLYK